MQGVTLFFVFVAFFSMVFSILFLNLMRQTNKILADYNIKADVRKYFKTERILFYTLSTFFITIFIQCINVLFFHLKH